MATIISRLTLLLCCAMVINSGIAADSAEQSPFIKAYRTVYQADYDFFLPLQGAVIRELSQQENGQWLLSHRADTSLASMKESSLFEWDNNQPKPLQYHYQQKSIAKDKQHQLEFNWREQQVNHTTNKPPGSFHLPKGTLDKLTYQLKMRHQLQLGQPLSTYSVADKRKLKDYRFNIVGSIELDTPMGKLNTLKIKRDRGTDSNRETVFWLAKDWDYLLVKIEQKENDKSHQITMVEGVLDGKTVRGHE